MTIPLIKEPEDLGPIIEVCHFCKNITGYWHENTNNPVCRECAKLHKVAELPDHGQALRRMKRKQRKTTLASEQTNSTKEIKEILKDAGIKLNPKKVETRMQELNQTHYPISWLTSTAFIGACIAAAREIERKDKEKPE